MKQILISFFLLIIVLPYFSCGKQIGKSLLNSDAEAIGPDITIYTFGEGFKFEPDRSYRKEEPHLEASFGLGHSEKDSSDAIESTISIKEPENVSDTNKGDLAIKKGEPFTYEDSLHSDIRVERISPKITRKTEQKTANQKYTSVGEMQSRLERKKIDLKEIYTGLVTVSLDPNINIESYLEEAGQQHNDQALTIMNNIEGLPSGVYILEDGNEVYSKSEQEVKNVTIYLKAVRSKYNRIKNNLTDTDKQQNEQLLFAADLSIVLAHQYFAEGEIDMGNTAIELAYAIGDLVIGVVPYVGWGQDLYEATSGKSLLTGQPLSDLEISLATLGAATGGFGNKPGKALKVLKILDKIFGKLKDTKFVRNVIISAKNLGFKFTKNKAGKVALDANQLIQGLDFGKMEALTKAINGRTPVISFTAAKEYLKKGNSDVLRKFLTETGGSISTSAGEAAVQSLMKQSEILKPLVKLKDARVASSAIADKIPLVTADKKLHKFLQKAGVEVELHVFQ